MPRRSLRAARFALTFKKIMQIVAIGKPLFENRTELPEAIEYNYQSGDHTLLLSMKNLHPKEVEAVREAEAEFGLYCENGIVFLLYRFGEVLPWSDSESRRFRPNSRKNCMTRFAGRRRASRFREMNSWVAACRFTKNSRPLTLPRMQS
jgi:hypothetical protein